VASGSAVLTPHGIRLGPDGAQTRLHDVQRVATAGPGSIRSRVSSSEKEARVTTFTPNRIQARKLKELDERRARAWSAYRDALRDLEGRDYEDAEHRSWERLQRKLRELEEQRAEVVGGAGEAPRPSAH